MSNFVYLDNVLYWIHAPYCNDYAMQGFKGNWVKIFDKYKCV